ncbi:MAG: MogA/MoaB family molybdenum cofactor biosynthesis protein [Chloroflexi bacterium]|nr:MogA/MoaB family molybdenum cofactor biosynthesis protein [Chloroflexota bacterium]
MTVEEHRQRAEAATSAIRCGIITASDTRTPATDRSGQLIRERLTAAGHLVVRYEVVPDDPTTIATLVQELAAAGCQLVIINGGTGLAKRDSTIDAVERLLEKRLPGFGELFRMLSFAQIGPAAMLSRATAGVISETLLFALPGSPQAVELALDRLILPELRHLVWEVSHH